MATTATSCYRASEQHAADARVAGVRRASDQPLPALRPSGARAALGPLAALRDVPAGAVFCRVRWESNDYGTTRWQLMVLQACTPLDACSASPASGPARACCCAPKAKQQVQSVLPQIDAIETLGIDPAAVSPAYWRTLGNRLSARLPLPAYTAERHAAYLAGEVSAMNTRTAPHRVVVALFTLRHRCARLAVVAHITGAHLSTTPATACRLAGIASARLTRCTSAASCSPGFRQRPPRWLRSVATCPSTSRCSSASARCHRSRCASRSTSFASTACRCWRHATVDGRGRPLSAWQQCRRLHDGELFLLSATNPASFDSRYFGPVAVSAVIGSAQPLWTWDTP
jgi:hypothetical protein